MRSVDVPEAPDLDLVRRVVEAVAKTKGVKDDVVATTGLAVRRVGYMMQAARILGWLHLDDHHAELTQLGRQLLQTRPGSEAERTAMMAAIRGSTQLEMLVPNLLDPAGPNRVELEARLQARAKLEPSTARKRAAAMLLWRERLFRRSLFDSLDADGVADSAPVANAAQRPASSTGVVRIHAVQISHFGPIRQAQAYLQPLSIVIGENASGKSTFFDSVSLVADVLNEGVYKAVQRRAKQLEELLTFGEGDAFQVAIELNLPSVLLGVRAQQPEQRRPEQPLARYELEMGRLEDGAVGIRRETLYLRPEGPLPAECCNLKSPPRWRRIVSRTTSGQAQFTAEKSSWKHSIHVGTDRLALGQLPGDEAKFPVGQRVAAFFRDGITVLALNTAAMRWAASPLLPKRLMADGSNWALVVDDLARNSPKAFRNWLRHVREVLPAVASVRVVERDEDRHLYVKVRYKDDLELPSWRLSDGTLRILTLTLLAFLPSNGGIYLIEEPENGVHPQAMEALFDTFRTPFDAQILLASHSPILLTAAPPDALLCFHKRGGTTQIVPGSDHPVLKNWRRDVPIELLFASGLLGG